MFPQEIKGFDCFVLKIRLQSLSFWTSGPKMLSFLQNVLNNSQVCEKFSLQENMPETILKDEYLTI